jgi:hypothetical protein
MIRMARSIFSGGRSSVSGLTAASTRSASMYRARVTRLRAARKQAALICFAVCGRRRLGCKLEFVIVSSIARARLAPPRAN